MLELLNPVQPQLVPKPAVVGDYYRCPQLIPGFGVADRLNARDGFFSLGSDLVCYGRSTLPLAAAKLNGNLFDVLPDVRHNETTILLPFDADNVTNNLRYERYATVEGWRGWLQASGLWDLYYQLRPI